MKPITLKTIGNKRTLKSSFSISGVTRNRVRIISCLTVKPSVKGDIRFRVKKKKAPYEIKVRPVSVVNPNAAHTTILGNNKGQEILTVEHLLSSLSGMGVDSALVEISDGNDIPIFDHSSYEFVSNIKRTGLKEINVKRKVGVVERDVYFSYKDSFAILRPSNKTKMSVLIQYDEPIGESFFSLFINEENYIKNIAWARSFIRTSCDKVVWERCKKEVLSLPENIEESPIPVFRNGDWIVNPKKHNEPARHKLLDLIGDLAPLEFSLLGHITVVRPGHNFNRLLMNYLSRISK
jgi:UDP-3-O-acyl-N-acetylglucosamine deacetylase